MTTRDKVLLGFAGLFILFTAFLNISNWNRLASRPHYETEMAYRGVNALAERLGIEKRVYHGARVQDFLDLTAQVTLRADQALIESVPSGPVTLLQSD